MAAAEGRPVHLLRQSRLEQQSPSWLGVAAAVVVFSLEERFRVWIWQT